MRKTAICACTLPVRIAFLSFCRKIYVLKEKIEKTRLPIRQVLIAAVTPPLLEKGADWFLQNFKKIEEDRLNNLFWARNTAILEVGQKISLSELLRRIAELGYTKVWEISFRGEFSQRGGIVRLFPINSEEPYAIEFEGNFICNIQNFESDEISNLRSDFRDASEPTPLRGRVKREKIRTERANQIQNFGFQYGDYVVHIDHGIGIYRGLTQTETQNNADLIIEYAAPKNHPEAPDLLFVPETEIKRIQPYLGFKKPEIHRLGTTFWEATKKKAKEDIMKYAKELLENFAKRKIVTRAPYEAHIDLEEELAASFSYEYTEDQQKSLEEIFDDMLHPEPMDRILTGDVGFGKTEVALRTAYRAILNNRQVALVAPTTILADQHFEVFKKRLESLGVSIARLSRLDEKSGIKKSIRQIAEGKIDLTIGTHKIFGKQIEFKNLGLLIVDEEQKFGVLQKEHFKKIKPELDILTLSATPIPRTLQLALSKIRSLSSLTSAPSGRIEIKTYVLPKNKKIIKEAILFELKRKGQIYFLANRIHKIPILIDELKKLRLRTKIGILHGRMPEKKIMETMHNFREEKINLLVSTTIIENGLDISNANTLIVEDSTKLGLAQAHQLRGRIGRGDKEASAYFLFSTQKLKERAAERLEALEKYSWLGAGLEIAKRDLELRGAGNILGKAQSGIAFRIGLNLYFELLEEAVEKLKILTS
ncbi:DEAD/DEAH box helicase [Candidatus Giovannonibacteria bacterium]|nr:DEAD/DEAH box helicase [Candidatus Giovannonibacteria bacterium]